MVTAAGATPTGARLAVKGSKVSLVKSNGRGV